MGRFSHRVAEIERVLGECFDTDTKAWIEELFQLTKEYNRPVKIPLMKGAQLSIAPGGGSYDLRSFDWFWLNSFWNHYRNPETGEWEEEYVEDAKMWEKGEIYTAKGEGMLLPKRPSAQQIRNMNAANAFLADTDQHEA